MIIDINEKKHLVLIPKNITKEKFLLEAKVIKGSYFYKRLESIYIALTSISTNVEDEYKIYYSEYDSFYDFLYYKYSYLTDDMVALIIEKLESRKYILLSGYVQNLVNYSLQILMDDDSFVDLKKRINTLLKAELYEN